MYKRICVVCGDDNATMAHIVSGNSNTKYPDFNTPRYKTDLDNKSSRNYIPLCGTLGKANSCHNEFDSFLLTFLYNPLTRKYFIISLNESWINHHRHGTEIELKHNPYNRLLVWRTRKCLIEFGSKFSFDQVSKIIGAADLSEETHSLPSSTSGSD